MISECTLVSYIVVVQFEANNEVSRLTDKLEKENFPVYTTTRV